MYSRASPLSDQDYREFQMMSINESLGSLVGYDCPKCKNRGFRATLDEKGIVTIPCTCIGIRNSLIAMEASGLKNVIRDFTFDKFQATEPWQVTLKTAAERYADNPDGWFLIAGQSGSGKSHLCTAICRQLLLDGHKVHFVQWRDVIPKILATKYAFDERESILKPLKCTEYVYIDDLFKQSMSEYIKPGKEEVSVAFEVLNYRINAGLPTIVTSELSMHQFNAIDSAIAGRLVDKAGKNVFFIGSDIKKNYRFRNIREL